MVELNEKAKKIFALKYSTRKTKSWKETCRNIADFIAEGEKPYGKTDKQIKEIADIFYNMLLELNILPGGRIIANAGTGIKNLANCFVLGIEDSRQSIYQTLKDAAEIFAMGGGVGYDFSKIREEGADIKSTGGKACLTGDTIVYRDRTGEPKKDEIPISTLFERKSNHKVLPMIRCMKENNSLDRNQLLNVIFNGKKDIYKITTEDGYSIKATNNHKFLNSNYKWQETRLFSTGDLIAVNGKTKELKICKRCEKERYVRGENSKYSGLCESCVVSVDNNCTLKGSKEYEKIMMVKKEKHKEYMNTPEMKNKLHHRFLGKNSECYKGNNATKRTSRGRIRIWYPNLNLSVCSSCEKFINRAEVHHIDHNPYNNNEDNLMVLCSLCHQHLHAMENSIGNPRLHKEIYFDSIISIEYAGVEKVYDLVMKSPYHNFIANGFVSHNSGALSFMSLFDQTGEVIQQASRRGAQLGTMNISSPDIENFINFKSVLNSRNRRLIQEYDRNLHLVDGRLNGTRYEQILEKTLLDDQLTHFNISVLLTDKFMQQVEKDGNWDLISPVSGNIIKTVRAKDLLYQMAKQAHVSGDPGQLFFDRINQDNMVAYIGNITASNPCGEVPLLEGESCILASINLHEMFDKKLKQINYEKLKITTKTITRFLEDVTEITEAPLEYINKISKALRRLGIGVLGFADLLVELNIPYESSEAIELSEYLSWFINFHAWETSFELAKERGHFKYYNKNKVNLFVVTKVLYDSLFEKSNIPIKKLYKIGLRNVSVTSIAPTGSIAIIGGVNGGIEPFFALAYKRNITEGVGNIAIDSIFEINPALEGKLKDAGYDKNKIQEILNYVISKGSLIGCKLVSKELQKLFKTANDIEWKTHIDIQAAWQKYISNAISKTSNISEKSTIDDIFNIYMYMWKKGLKGGTIYRQNSKSFQILEKPNGK